MKLCGQEMQVTLQVHGRERTFSEKELIAILEEYLPNEATGNPCTVKVVQSPTENEWFQVNPLTIERKLFQEERMNRKEEYTRQLILEAFEELRKNPKKYGKNFKTMFPEKSWHYKDYEQLKELAMDLGDHMADWVEQAFEWAQRIANGETWETVCNDRDTANWYRAVVWKYGYVQLVGGSRNHHDCDPACSINVNTLSPASSNSISQYFAYSFLLNTVPLVVLYENSSTVHCST